MAVRINSYRIQAVARAISGIGLEGVLAIEESDPQYRALEYLVRRLGDCGSAFLLVVLNSLSAYQLSSTGEDYWWEFARYPFSPGDPGRLVEDFISFLRGSRGNVAARDKKIERVMRIASNQAHIEIYADYGKMVEDLEVLREILKRSLKKEGSEKTIVFAIKMFYYVARICGYKPRIPMSIEIPIDRRIAAITYTSEIADTTGSDPVGEIMRNYREAQKAWSTISRIAGIPPINLDSILWICGKHVRENDRVEKAYRELKSYAGGRVDDKALRKAVEELLRRKIP
jgi:DNA-(apurinic or apyrimidinic site) lyase